MGMTKVRKIIPDILIDMVKKQVNSIDDVNEQVKTIAPQPKKCGGTIMLEYDMIAELTRSEVKICNLFTNTDSFDYSYSELGNMLNMSRQTVCSSLSKLVKKGYIKKIRFFEGRIQRNRYVALEKLKINQKIIYR